MLNALMDLLLSLDRAIEVVIVHFPQCRRFGVVAYFNAWEDLIDTQCTYSQEIFPGKATTPKRHRGNKQ